MPEFATALIAGLPLGVVITALSKRLGLLDRPGPIKPHVRPVPYTGGAMIAVTLSVFAPFLGIPIPALLGLALVWLVGFIDDVHGLRPSVKLGAAIPALGLGSLAVELGPVERLAAIAVGAVLINAFNVVDGLDGLAGGTAALSLLAVALMPNALAPLAMAALGSVVAFLVFNLPPARLFLGDEGSLLLGYLLWLLPLGAVGVTAPSRLVVAVALLWLFPLVNAAFVIITRVREGRSMVAGDRSHLYDVLHRRLGLRGTLVVCWGIAAVGAAAAAALV